VKIAWRRKFFSLAIAACLCSLAGLAQGAQGGPDFEKTIEVIIRSGSGKERAPLTNDGVVDRVGLRPGQVVSIRLKAHGHANSEPVFFTALDGGQLWSDAPLALDGNGKTEFYYEGAFSPGLYRVLLRIGSTEYMLTFYVLDLENPEKNPPRVRVVD
jgi:hypothetical protein